MIHVVDASVVVKALVPELGSIEAAEVLRHPVAAPDLLVPECLHALWKKFVRRELSQAEAVTAALQLESAGIALEPTQPLAGEAMALSLRLGYPAYDCFYLALAQRLGGELITADDKLVARCSQRDAAALSLRVVSLRDFRPMIQERAVRPYIARRRAA